MKQTHTLRLLLAATVLAGAAVIPPAAAVELPNKTLVYCSEGSPAGFDPGQLTTGTDFDPADAIYNRLIAFVPGETGVMPSLAEKWDISPDNKVYTFHLRKGVKFHTTEYFKPTRDFNAEDVKFTFERMGDREMPFRKAYPAEFPYYVDMGLQADIERIEIVDPYTVRFVLKKVDAPFIQNLAMSFASILSKEYADKLLAANNPRDIALKPVGTGPFIFRSYTKDATLRMDGNKEYWNTNLPPKVGKLVFAITTDANVRIQKLKRNECQVVTYPRPADVDALKAEIQAQGKSSKLKMPDQVGFNLGYVAYNVKKAPLDRVEVRQALDMAINKKAILQSVYGSAGQLSNGAPMPPTQWSYDKNIKSASYDPEKAKALLDKAGVKGVEITLWAMPVQRPYNPNGKLMAEMIQADWAKIGVKANIVTYEWGEYIKRAKAGEHDAMLIGWTGDNGDPDNWLGVLLGCDSMNGNNFSKWCDKPFDDLIKQARQTTDVKERTRLYTQAQQIFAQQLPFSPIAHSTQYKPMATNVKGFKLSPFSRNSFAGVSLD
ncbi:peptide ABC transporter substrate-binding protein [Pandoraea captiosa]|uniref:Peptide ABC transporter substrate-binding protein n=1 Tax=Pandoraea captiosa TaxID=2508302 RepID=A0A5E4ZSR4_9BURK|nr:ABC transporter substrate-binding protein [Pandoraea captiosa]VVE63928.1 peptide ABC transporter substrate-binding protein [Pandoraea captiosa]